MGQYRPSGKHNNARIKIQNDIRTSKRKETSPIFNCVTPVSVSLANKPVSCLYTYIYNIIYIVLLQQLFVVEQECSFNVSISGYLKFFCVQFFSLLFFHFYVNREEA